MNTKILNTLVVLMLIGTIACNSIALEKLESIKVNQDELAATVIESIQLQAQGGQIDVAIRMLEELILDLNSQQKDSDADHLKRNTEWAKLIKQYQSTIALLNAKITDLQVNIDKTLKHIKSTKHKIAVDKRQILLVERKLKDLHEARRVDKQATKERMNRQQEMLKAVNYIISELQKMLRSGTFVQLPKIKEELQKLVKQNPVQALVQLTMTFDPQSVSFAVKKLVEIRDALLASLKDELVQEKEAKSQFISLRAELREFLKNSKKDLDHQIAHLASLQSHLAQLQKDLQETRDLLKKNQQLLRLTIQARDAYNHTYHVNKLQRAHEVKIIREVIIILQEHTGATNHAEGFRLTPKQEAAANHQRKAQRRAIMSIA